MSGQLRERCRQTNTTKSPMAQVESRKRRRFVGTIPADHIATASAITDHVSRTGAYTTFDKNSIIAAPAIAPLDTER